jgi:glycosyltransferase involved in cell wall biosynthesis
MKLSIIIPVYNEVNTISALVQLVLEACERLPEKVTDFEIVIVEDGSSDGTQNILKETFSTHPKLRLFFQEINQGKGAAITRGFSEATGSIILIQDADMEYDPFEYPDLLLPILDNKADVVYGSRFKGNTTRVLYFWHSLGNKFLTLFSNMFTDLNLSDMETCYKVFRSPIVKNMVLTSKRFGIEPEMTAKVSKLSQVRIYEIPISYYGRTYAEGKKIGWKDGFSAIWCIFKFNVLCSTSSSFKKDPDQIMKEL